VREVGEHIAGGIIMLRNEVKRPIRVYSVPGNHGRMTIKPQSKGRSAGSLDLLAMDFAEATTRGARLKDVTFYKAISPDCYFSTYGWHWLLTHGDAMGGRGGGTGFIGPMATIIKGHRKLVDTSWRSARPVHLRADRALSHDGQDDIRLGERLGLQLWRIRPRSPRRS
jgi:hypothetical protein